MHIEREFQAGGRLMSMVLGDIISSDEVPRAQTIKTQPNQEFHRAKDVALTS